MYHFVDENNKNNNNGGDGGGGSLNDDGKLYSMEKVYGRPKWMGIKYTW